MRIKIIIFCLIACLLTGCTWVVKVARYIHDSDKLDNYIYDEGTVVNKYIEKIVEAFNTNDRELLASLFPEHARSKIDNFDENGITIGFIDEDPFVLFKHGKKVPYDQFAEFTTETTNK